MPRFFAQPAIIAAHPIMTAPVGVGRVRPLGYRAPGGRDGRGTRQAAPSQWTGLSTRKRGL